MILATQSEYLVSLLDSRKKNWQILDDAQSSVLIPISTFVFMGKSRKKLSSKVSSLLKNMSIGSFNV